ncbi:MAG TPA: right-handed parallel beta-helix repeat-containing protein [Candidatus Hydrogenedentes bacterium]|nr:right-handed parallel beta-helix repeat-containing protein [Candidatus Hydrogenedentota bacterium]
MRCLLSSFYVLSCVFAAGVLCVPQAGAVIVVETATNWEDIAPVAQLDEAVVVRNGGVLTINAGVNLVWVETVDAELGAITVETGSTLVAIGEAGDPITFSSTHSLGWYGISIHDGATATLEYCSLAGGGSGGSASLALGASASAVRHCTISGGAGNGVQLNGAGNTSVIEDLTVTGCAGYALHQNTGDMNPQIIGVNFSGNGENANVIWPGTPAVAGVFRQVDWQMVGAPYVIAGWYKLGENGILNISPGVRVEFAESASARQSSIGASALGCLNIQGTVENPVLFTSHFEAPEPGDWADLAIDEGGSGTLENIIVEYAGQWGNYSVHIASSEVAVHNLEIRHSSCDGLWLDAPLITPSLDGLVIHDTAGWPLVMYTNNMSPVIGESLNFYNNPSGNGMLVLSGSGEQTTSNIVWTVNSMPYVIAGWFRIGIGSSFTIEPGVNVTFTAAGTALQSNIEVMDGGTFTVEGTASKPVHFTSFKSDPAPGDWSFIQVDQGGQASFDQCRIRYAGCANSPAFIVKTSDVTVSNMLIEDCQYDGIQLNNVGISPSLSNIVVRNCVGWGIVQTAITMMPTYSNISLYDNTGGNAIVMWAGTGGNSVSQDMHWHLCGAPYAVSGWARFAENVHLEIDPGVIVQFAPSGAAMQSNFELNNGCSLIANGTPSQRILFTSYKSEPAMGDWEFIQFNAGSSGSFNYCTFEYANNPLNIRTSPVTVQNSIIRSSNYQGVVVQDNAQPVFINNHIEGNRLNGFLSYSAGTPVDLRGTWWGDASGPYHATLNPGGLGNAVTDGCLFEPWATEPVIGSTLFAWPPTVRIDLEGGNGYVAVENTGSGSFTWNVQVTSGQDWLSVQTVKSGEAAGFTVVAEPYSGALQRVGQIMLTTSDLSVAPQTILVAQAGSEGAGVLHSGDQNQDFLISLSELLRVIQFFNSGGFHCEAGTEDGFAPAPGDTSCTPHSSDYNTQNWQISLSELLRIVQFFNSGGYHQNAGGEDGFGPGKLL